MLKTITAGAVALSFLASAHASVTQIDITGSSAFRKAVFKAINDMLVSGTGATGMKIASTNADLTKASAANFSGFTTASGGVDQVLIRTSFSGSVGGVVNVAQGSAPTWGFLPVATSGTFGSFNGSATTGGITSYTAASINGNTGVISDGAQTDHPTNVPVCFSDVFQATSGFTQAADAPYTSTDLVENSVGVIAFKWVANNGSPSYLTNINVGQAKELFSVGAIPLSILTGSSSDRTTLVTPAHKTLGVNIAYSGSSAPAYVFAAGRDIDSGTRATALIESGIGFGGAVVQFAPLNSGTNIIGVSSAVGPVDNHKLYPAEILNGFSYDAGNTGYNSGGNLAAGMSATGSLAAVGGYYITYLSTGDATTAITGGAHELTWNGIGYSASNVQEGVYSFWGYEHMDWIPSLADNGQFAGSKELTITTLLKSQVIANASAAGLSLSSMHVVRATDGDLITY